MGVCQKPKSLKKLRQDLFLEVKDFEYLKILIQSVATIRSQCHETLRYKLGEKHSLIVSLLLQFFANKEERI